MKNSSGLFSKYFISLAFIIMGSGFFFLYKNAGSGVNYEGSIEIVPVVVTVLLVAGVIMLAVAIANTFKVIKYNKLKKDPNAHFTTATFKDVIYKSTSSVSVNRMVTSENEYFTVVYDYTDETGFRHENVESVVWFVPKQVEYLKAKGSFSIRCKGGLSAIVEELPEANEDYNVVEEGSNLIEKTSDSGVNNIDSNGQKVFDSQTARDISESVGIFEDNGITDSYMIEKICDDIVVYFNDTSKTFEDLSISVAKAFRANGYEISQNDAIGFADCYFEED